MVDVFPTPEAVMNAAADRFAAAAAHAARARGRFAVALAGGSTPEGLYRRLMMDPYRNRVDWSRLEVFWGDERCVPPDDAASNYRMAREALLDRVPIPAANIHRIRGEAEPAIAAREYENTLRERFGTPDGPPRSGASFDLVLLGLGPDGHTASLFPGSAALRERNRWVCAVSAPAPPSRITLTPMILGAAREIVFLVTGAAKAAALHRALQGVPQPGQQPAQAVASRNKNVRWLVDATAAGEAA
jgi:6-phosphogluconolactonase